jgi:hypothetical protein
MCLSDRSGCHFHILYLGRLLTVDNREAAGGLNLSGSGHPGAEVVAAYAEDMFLSAPLNSRAHKTERFLMLLRSDHSSLLTPRFCSFEPVTFDLSRQTTATKHKYFKSRIVSCEPFVSDIQYNTRTPVKQLHPVHYRVVVRPTQAAQLSQICFLNLPIRNCTPHGTGEEKYYCTRGTWNPTPHRSLFQIKRAC